MHDGHQGNAMTEVALALAMGFFSLLVLTMVSMGAGRGNDTSALAAILAPRPSQTGAKGAIELNSEDIVLIYHEGGFLNTDLKPIEPHVLDSTKRVVLAFAPSVSIAEAVSARSQISAEHLVVSTLDDRWLAALASLGARKGSER